eukprot:145441-Pleurochrysis_carterae.AAC.1
MHRLQMRTCLSIQVPCNSASVRELRRKGTEDESRSKAKKQAREQASLLVSRYHLSEDVVLRGESASARAPTARASVRAKTSLRV